nr:MAG TPA: hypothetical protein [Crassvirales sp.]
MLRLYLAVVALLYLLYTILVGVVFVIVSLPNTLLQWKQSRTSVNRPLFCLTLICPTMMSLPSASTHSVVLRNASTMTLTRKSLWGWVEKIVLDSAEARNRDLMAGISMFATEEEYRILYGKLCGMAQTDYWIDLDIELSQNAATAAEETRKSAYLSDEFDLTLDEETGKVKMCRDHLRLTEEDYEEMERLEVDDNFHASLYEADDLPF